MIDGDLPNKAQDLIKEWLHIYQNELLNMWQSQQITKLPPIE